MDRKELNKAAIIHAKIMGDVPEINSIHAFKSGAEWLMQQPLSERLTAKEKKKIRGIHTTNASIFTESNDEVLNAYSTGVMLSIERIFGADLFKAK